MSTPRFDQLIWIFIYGGMIVGGVGFALRRTGSDLGPVLLAIGAIAVVVGATMIWIRSRRAGSKEPK